MSLYRISNGEILPVARTTFSEQKVKERDTQKMLKSHIEIISPSTLIVAEEFGDWEDSRRRIDLLGIDKDANLVVIELKRTEDGGHMEMQSIRYAAMISTLTFDKLIQIYTKYLSENNIQLDASNSLLEFLEWSEPDEENFGQEVKIVLASAEFSRELTTSVMWLNDYGLNIRCVRMHPYTNNGETFIDIQTVIPIPEVADYQIRIREKKQKEREYRTSSKDFTKYDVKINNQAYSTLSKRWMMFHIISEALKTGATPDQIAEILPWRKNRLFEAFDGELNAEQVYAHIMQSDTEGRIPRAKRFFSEDGEFFHFKKKTYVLSNQWGDKTLESVEALSKAFPDLKIEFNPSQ